MLRASARARRAPLRPRSAAGAAAAAPRGAGGAPLGTCGGGRRAGRPLRGVAARWHGGAAGHCAAVTSARAGGGAVVGWQACGLVELDSCCRRADGFRLSGRARGAPRRGGPSRRRCRGRAMARSGRLDAGAVVAGACVHRRRRAGVVTRCLG